MITLHPVAVLFALAVSAEAAPSPPALPPPTRQESVQTCIAMVVPSVRGVEGSATDVGAALRELFASYLTGPSMQVIPLDARLATHAMDEAQQKGCSNLLAVTLTRKRKSGGGLLGKVMGQAGSSVAWGIPGGSMTTAVARGAVMAASEAVNELASSTREKDELTLEYAVTGADGRTVLSPKQDKAKAKADGEDLVTPLVERAATAIAAAVSPR